MIPVWEAGKTYSPGALVRPASAKAATATIIPNGDFENGTTAWTFPAGFSIITDKNYNGTKSVKYLSSGTIGSNFSTMRAPVTPGQSITANIYVSLDHIAAKQSSGRIVIQWYDKNGTALTFSPGNLVDQARNGVWQLSTVTANAPAGAATATVFISAASDKQAFARFDGASWNYTYAGNTDGLVFKAVQDGPGKSAASEPVWPVVNGLTVIDNEVVWESVIASRIVWQASPLMTSGEFEPIWPTAIGGNVRDGNINWTAGTTQITDPNCPKSPIVAIAAGKVYVGDNDIIRYSATVNPLDWSTPDDAGYLPFGLQTYGSNPVAALGLYRSNIVAFNAEGFQMWQVDEDPSATALLDALPIGSTQHHALSPVANDLFFLASQGVRTVGIAAGSTNLKAGDVGLPIDPLLRDALDAADESPISTYVPSLGQYWLAFSDPSDPGLGFTGDLQDGATGDVVSFQYLSTNAVGNTVFSIVSGNVPDGLVLNDNGTVTGTRADAGLYQWTVGAVDEAGIWAQRDDTSVTSVATTPGSDIWARAISGNGTELAKRSINRNQWHLVIADINTEAGIVTLYVDDLPGVTTHPPAIPNEELSNYDIAVGGDLWPDASFNAFTGLLWGSGVANNSLTDVERSYLWNGGNGRTFASMASDASSIWQKMVYAWQLNEPANVSKYRDARSGYYLEKLGVVGSVYDKKFGQVASFAKNGKLLGHGTADNENLVRGHRTMFAWAYSTMNTEDVVTDDFVISCYDGVSQGRALIYSVNEN